MSKNLRTCSCKIESWWVYFYNKNAFSLNLNKRFIEATWVKRLALRLHPNNPIFEKFRLREVERKFTKKIDPIKGYEFNVNISNVNNIIFNPR